MDGCCARQRGGELLARLAEEGEARRENLPHSEQLLLAAGGATSTVELGCEFEGAAGHRFLAPPGAATAPPPPEMALTALLRDPTSLTRPCAAARRCA